MNNKSQNQVSWDDAQTFLSVCELRSFSGAAQELGVGQPTISRRIAGLEHRLGVQLFRRGRQGAELTEAARGLLPAAEQMARWAAEFVRSTQGSEQEIAGPVRIAAPPGVAVEHLAHFAQQIKHTFPDVMLEIRASIEHIDLTRGGADLAIRNRSPQEPELTTLCHATTPVGVYAAASYAGRVKYPCDWADLDWITWSTPYEQVAPRPMLERIIPDFRPVFTSDNYLVQKSALHAGLGVMIIGKPSYPNALDDGLVEVDLGVVLPSDDFYLVCAKSMQQVPRVKAVADALIGMIESYFG